MAADPVGQASEGVLKFTVGRREDLPPFTADLYGRLEEWRSRLWQLGLIGQDSRLRLGYGNISCRLGQEDAVLAGSLPAGAFLVSASQTGHKAVLGGSDYAVILEADFAGNSVACRGPSLPSSEAMSHAALYERPAVGAVIHVHHAGLWRYLQDVAAGSDPAVSETAAGIAYGSRELYQRFGELVQAADLPLVIVTRGHQDGVFVAATDLAKAFETVLHYMRLAGYEPDAEEEA